MKLTNIQVNIIKQLIEDTGYGMLDCKNTLIQNNWNIDKSKELLAKRDKHLKIIRLDNLAQIK